MEPYTGPEFYTYDVIQSSVIINGNEYEVL